MTTFKERHPEMQHLARELHLLRSHNLTFKQGDPQDKLLMFAEAALVTLAIERFVRIVLGDEAPEGATIYNLLQKAVSKGLLRVPWDDQQDGIKKIANVRNTLLHGNYEQAAKQAGRASVAEFFANDFAGEIEELYRIADYLAKQIDTETGKPRKNTP